MPVAHLSEVPAKPKTSPASLVSYYREHEINPVPIPVEEPAAWQSHIAKRRNLYEKHLGIPLSLLRDRSVLEFGCNSGENALVLAGFGANLTLVEPNNQVYPRLKSQFQRYDLEDQIVDLVQQDVDGFQSLHKYDLVIAEGFINHLKKPGEAAQKIFSHVAPGGLAVISFDCIYGHFVEMTRKFVFWRACRLAGIEDVYSNDALHIAQQLYLEDFQRINTSRPFEAWWQDVLVNPFVSWDCLWNYQELIQAAQNANVEFLSSSPRWASIDDFNWHKNVSDIRSRHQRLLDEWYTQFPYFLTGLRPPFEGPGPGPADADIAVSVSSLIAQISDHTTSSCKKKNSVKYPDALNAYFKKSTDPRLQTFNREMKQLYNASQMNNFDNLLSTYHGLSSLRKLWGAPYHYISFNKIN